MPVVSKIQNGWTAGELDPKLRARLDIASFYMGGSKIRNALVIPQGACKRRPGLEYMGALSLGSIQMIPFHFSESEHYLCILSENNMTIFKGGQVIDTVVCSISNLQIPDVTYAQSYDTLLIFHQEFTPTAFIRNTETIWTNSDWTLNNIPSKNFAGGTTTTITIIDSKSFNIDFSTWSQGDIESDAKFSAEDATWTVSNVGDYIRGSLGGYAIITAYTDATNVVGTILAPFTNDTNGGGTKYSADEWSMEEASWSSSRGYPACGTFFQGRLWMANTIAQPNTLWASKTNNEYDFQNWIPKYDDNGIEVTAGGGVMSKFKQLFAGQHLYILADTGEYYIPVSKNEAVTPTNVSITRNSSYGTSGVSPAVEIDGAIVFLKSGGKALIESQYNFAQGSYINKDLSLLSSHLLNNPVSMAYRKQTSTDESDYVLVVNEDGSLSVLCTLRVQDVTAWTHCLTDGLFKAVAVDGNDMYFAIDRIINGVLTRTLEKFNDDLFVDCGLHVINDPASNTVSGLTYLDGEEVAIVCDNTVQPSQTVSGDTLTLARVSEDVQVGLSFPIVDADSGSQVFIETMPIEVDMQNETSVGKKKRVISATVMVYETSHANVKKNKVTIRKIGIDKLDTPVPKISANITINGLLGWSSEISVSIGQTLPLPMTLLGLQYNIKV